MSLANGPTAVSYTHLYDYLRLLYARAGVAYSYLSGEKMVEYTEEQIIGLIHRDYQGKKIFMLAPLVRCLLYTSTVQLL